MEEINQSGTNLYLRENNELIKQNNKRLDNQAKLFKGLGKSIIIILIAWTIIILWLIYYVISHNVVNNIVARCT